MCVWPPCYDVLRHVECCRLKFENGQIFHAIFVDVARCCSSLVRFVQQCCTWACALVQFSTRNMSQHVATEWPNACNMLRPTMLWSFGRSLQMLSQQGWDTLHWGVAIVWPGFRSTPFLWCTVCNPRLFYVNRFLKGWFYGLVHKEALILAHLIPFLMEQSKSSKWFQCHFTLKRFTVSRKNTAT